VQTDRRTLERHQPTGERPRQLPGHRQSARFPAGQRIRRQPERHIPESHAAQGPQRALQLGVSSQHRPQGRCIGAQDLERVPPLPAHPEDIGREPSTVAHAAADAHVRQGLQPNRLNELIGQRLPIAKKSGEVFFPSDLETPAAKPRTYNFQQPFGLPVRYHDINTFAKVSNLNLVEIHLSYKDLDVDLDEVLPDRQNIGLVIHAPELFAGDHTLDLCTEDNSYRNHSIKELQRVIDISRDLRQRFECSEPVLLVTNVGGFSEHRHLDHEEKKPLRDRLIQSLNSIHTAGEVEIIPQTMPPFPWHFGGQRFHNLFVESDFIQEFCREVGMRVCLDVSHSKLACNHLNQPFSEFLKQILPFTAHLHLADAKDVDGEGLQINDGDIDWPHLFEEINKYCPKATFIPEIWQGHKNGGEGAWLALERLEEAAA